jgi:preprotein translocase subunit Sec61beta
MYCELIEAAYAKAVSINPVLFVMLGFIIGALTTAAGILFAKFLDL